MRSNTNDDQLSILHRVRDIKRLSFGVMTFTVWGHVTSLVLEFPDVKNYK